MEGAKKWYEMNKTKFEDVVAFASPDSGYREILKVMNVDRYVPEECPDIEVGYVKNVSRVYTQPRVWKELEVVVVEVIYLIQNHLQKRSRGISYMN